jgi:endothelin-converting enzyme/putative endopeptidase
VGAPPARLLDAVLQLVGATRATAATGAATRATDEEPAFWRGKCRRGAGIIAAMKHLGLLLVTMLAACGSHASSAPPEQPAPAPAAPAPAAPAAPASKEHGVFVGDLDRSVDPCTDFFEFANGTWRKQNPIPASMQRWSRRWKSGEDSKDQLKLILDEVSAKTDWPKASVEQLIGDLYGGCLDQARADARGLEPVKPVLAEIDALRDAKAVGKILGRLVALGYAPVDDPDGNPGVNAMPFVVVGYNDLHEPTQVITWVGAGGLGLPDRDYYVKPEPRFAEARAKYLEHVAQIFALAGRTPAAAKQAATTVMAFETALAKASLDNVALRDPASIDHPMTLAQLQKITPSFDWTAHFAALGIQPGKLNVTQPAFLAEVERQLKQTPVAAWKTYLTWHVLHGASPWLTRAFGDATFAFFDKYLGGTPEAKPRWKQCVQVTDVLLGEALGKKYTDKYFPPAAKARMQLLVKNMLAAVKDSIEQLDWMSAATKQRALEKLATFNPKVGYPDKWKDYSSVPVKRDAFFESAWAGRIWFLRDNFAQIGKPVDRGRWGMTPPTSNAYYNPSLNEIVFPAGILQPPAFALDGVDAINYGAIGVVIGHEISHGFDDQGAKFDAVGRLNNWWTPDDLAQFQKRGQCVVDQFDHYFIEPEIHHNGKLVLGESIGDLGGANIAYRAFQKAKAQAPQPTLDGFTPDQQFFIAWGQFRGDAIRPETQRLMVQGDPHPIGKFRVIGPLSNIPAFQQAFQCKADSAMVRPAGQRCAIW